MAAWIALTRATLNQDINMTTKEAIKYFGSRRAISEALGINLFATYKKAWNPEPPKLRQFEMERISKGKLKVTKGRS